MSILIRLACPNCGYNLAEEDLHSNILLCPRCRCYSYYESGMYNVNVFFGLLKSNTYHLDGLRSTIIDLLTRQGSLKAIRSMRFLHAERVLVPVREIDHNGSPKAVPLLELNQESKDEHPDIRQLLQDVGSVSSLFSMQYLQPLRLGAMAEEIDRSGYVTRTTILPVGRTKMAVDTAYGLKPDSLLRILYVPLFRLSFRNGGESLLCFANSELTGLPLTKEDIPHEGLDIEDIVILSKGISVVLAIAIMILIIVTGNISVDRYDLVGILFLLIGIAVVIVVFCLIIFAASLVVLFLLSKLSISLNVAGAIRRWYIRHTLNRRFRLNERCK